MVRFSVLALCGALLFAESAWGQFRPKVKILDPQVGLPAGRFATERDNNFRAAPIVKNGFWTPVRFGLEVLGETESRLKVVIESYDADEYKTTISWPIGSLLLNPNPQTPDDKFRARGSRIEPTEIPTIAYTRIAARPSETTLRIWTDDPDSTSTPVSDIMRLDDLRVRDQSLFTVVSLGSNLRGFRLPDLVRKSENANANANGLRGGRVEMARYDSVSAMPDQWYGYDAADLVVLATGSTPVAFLQELFDEQLSQPYTAKREALLEWVRRGGRLVISGAKKGNELIQMKYFTEFLPARIAGTEQVASILISTSNDSVRMPRTADTFPILKLEPKADRLPDYLMPARDRDGSLPRNQADQPLVLQYPFGLGKITLFAFDLDEDPIASLANNRAAALWEWVLKNGGSDKAYLGNPAGKDFGYGDAAMSPTESEDGTLAGLRTTLDTFEGVPVISFGWVALFIVLYTLIIGPVEYFFLKKVIGRLELTWITFPLIVITVSAAAYFTAYAVKGKDMRMNKIDIVDIDLGSNRIYGRTYFTIFSPRPDSYTLAVEPKESWGVSLKTNDQAPMPGSLVESLGGIKTGQSGFTRSFQDYQYRLDATGKKSAANGLNGVPIAVWSTKAFEAKWSAALDPTRPPLTSTISHPPANALRATGSVTLNIPAQDVAEAAWVYRDHFVRIPALPSGTPISFSSPDPRDPNAKSQFLRMENWFHTGDTTNQSLPQGTVRRDRPANEPNNLASAVSFGTSSLWGVLFHDATISTSGDNRGPQNSTLRSLDQSWRLNPGHTEEVILLVRLRMESGQAEDILGGAQSSSPSTLWLRGAPGGENPRDPVPGVLRQETYLRFYIPVRKAGA